MLARMGNGEFEDWRGMETFFRKRRRGSGTVVWMSRRRGGPWIVRWGWVKSPMVGFGSFWLGLVMLAWYDAVWRLLT